MKLALISDIHANRVAMEAVLADLKDRSVDRILCLGDVATLGPEPNATVDMLREMGCPCIMGNHDSFLLGPDEATTYTDAPVVLEAIAWCKEKITKQNLDFLATFVKTLDIDLPGGKRLLAYHGDPESNTGVLAPWTPEEQLDALIPDRRYVLLTGGHIHFPMVRRRGETYFVNPGSVGLPFVHADAKGAPSLLAGTEYALVEYTGKGIGIELRRAGLDTAELIQAVADSDITMKEWLIQEYSRIDDDSP